MKSNNWDWMEISLKELGECRTFSDISRKYRGSSPVGLITYMEGLKDFVVLNLLSPINSAFWAAARLSVFNGINEHLGNAGCNENNKKFFLKDLRIAGVKQQDAAIRLFDLYTEFFPSRTNRVPGYSHDGVATPEAYRMISTGCHISILNNVIAYFEKEIEQFAEYAFFAIDDSISLGAPVQYDKFNTAAYMFRLWMPSVNMDEGDITEWRRDIRSQLEWAVNRVAAGELLDMPIEPLFILRPCPSFVLRGKESSLRLREIDNPDSRIILSLRTRLIRLLEWPIFYDDVVRVLISVDDGVNRLDSYGNFEPYDVKTELEAYKEVMESRYPCLLDKPFSYNGLRWKS